MNFRDPKVTQAQIGIIGQRTKNISDIKLQIIQTIKTERENAEDIRVCVILPDCNLLMAKNTEENLLTEYSGTGQIVREIPVSDMPSDIAVMYPDRVVVTYADALFAEIMNINTFKVEKKIALTNGCLGISLKDGRLYVVSGKSTIQVHDLFGRHLETLKITSDSFVHVTTSRDNIFYIDYNTYKVHCCRLNGEELWQFESDSIKLPCDITVDSHNNVYVLGYDSNNLTIIQHDGKYSKLLLTESDGLNCPICVDLDKDKGTLLICNRGGTVTLYKVV